MRFGAENSRIGSPKAKNFRIVSETER